MDRHARLGLSFLVVLICIVIEAASAQDIQGVPPVDQNSAGGWNRPEAIVAGALRANPLTAPYAIFAGSKNGTIVLSGRVGTTAIHDVAVRTVIDLGYQVRDDLVIDTGEAHRVALSRTPQPYWAAGPWGGTAGSAPYLVYPPPLFGRVDDPFFGFEPPLVSFPPWAGARALETLRGAGMDPTQVPAGQLGPTAQRTVPGAPGMQPSALGANAPVKGKLQLTVDTGGQVFLTGEVASEEDRRVIEEEARNTPGVSRVFSDLHVASRTPETPPPPPQPYVSPQPEPRPAVPAPAVPAPPPAPSTRPAPSQLQPKAPSPPAAPARSQPAKSQAPARGPVVLAMARDTQKLTRRVADALARRPVLATLPIAVQSRGDIVTLSGTVPSAYEAMLAYRSVEQTPGVREIVDQLQFQLPDENHPNPLKQKARPDDLEPYLVSQIRRHLGDIAHVDVVRLRGDMIEIRGTVADPQDTNRVGAILRSMPLLRDFHLEPTLVAE
jgi:osmotically-inducible protein OsmY